MNPICRLRILCIPQAELTEDPEDGDIVLEIESHEEGFLAKILLAEVRARVRVSVSVGMRARVRVKEGFLANILLAEVRLRGRGM